GKDFFTTKRLNATGSLQQFANANAVSLLGVTAEVDYQLTDQWAARTGYAFQRSKITDDPNASIIGNAVWDVPRNKVMMGVGYDNASILSADVTAKYRDITYSDNTNTLTCPSYWNFDLAIWKKIGADLTARLDIENVFNNKYVSPGGPVGLTQSPGRFFMGTLRVAF
ncbi:MAG: TonB-dependent receptor, partial [candidate division NC10 bacterium]